MNRNNNSSSDKQIIGDEENLHPNNRPGKKRSSSRRNSAMPNARANVAHSSKVVANAPTANSTRASLLNLFNDVTLYHTVFLLLVKALIITVLINFHLVSVLSKLRPDLSMSHIRNDNTNFPLNDHDAVTACVRHVGGSCHLYPCIKDAYGTFNEIDATERPFGYAGRFVHRDIDVDKPLMNTIGDRGWGSGCAVSDKYKFVYIHVLKSGGTATKEFLRKSLCGEEDKDCEKVDPHILRPSGCRAAILNNSDYFTFSFVRNPFSRMYSMYSMMDGFPLIPGQKVTETFSFSDFVLKPEKRENHTAMHAGHYERQTNFIFSNHTCPSFDFLGRVEHYDEDMRTILNHLDASEVLEYLESIGGSVLPANTWGANKKQSIGGDFRKEYSSKEVAEEVVAVYRRDFDLLGYDKFDLPSN